MGLTIAALAISDSAAAHARTLLQSIGATAGDAVRLCLFHAFLGDGAAGDPADGLTRIDVSALLRDRATNHLATGQPVLDREAYYRTVPFADRDLKALPLVHPALAGDDVIVLDLDRPASAILAAALWPTIRRHHLFCAFTDRTDAQAVLRRGKRIYQYPTLKAALAHCGLAPARHGVANGTVVGRRATGRGHAVAALYDQLLRDKPPLLPDLGDYFHADFYLTAALSALTADEIAALPGYAEIETAAASAQPSKDVTPAPADPSQPTAPDDEKAPDAAPAPPANAASIIGVSSDAGHLARLPVATARLWSHLRRLVDDDTRSLGDRVLRAMALGRIAPGSRPDVTLIQKITSPDMTLSLHGHPVRFLSHLDFAVQLDEIFGHRHYAFETDQPAPVIVDCGANIGLASLFFKLQHPKARIVAYEPNGACAAVFRENMASFGFSDVDLREAAVAAADGEVIFNDCPRMPMASSMSSRMSELGYELEPRRVKAMSIAPDLKDGADFLKIDIEGAEYDVLPAIGPLLGKVRRMFCEFHFGGTLTRAALTRSLAVLDAAGLDWVLTIAQAEIPSPFLHDGRKGGWLGSTNLWARPFAPPAEGAPPAGPHVAAGA